MKFRRVTWSLALLAVLLNLGSPMAWAEAVVSEPASECHGHATQAADEDTSPMMPCCEDGDCSCVAPALSLAAALVPAQAPHPAFIAPADTSALPAHPFDDSLRPPIR